ncbi:MAG: DUF2207 domain-containing protein [Chloroflexota bacterium]|nr:DUF2207 domain-containing protein [Chloroflexota bacterium]
MRRLVAGLPLAAVGSLLLLGLALAAGPPFPGPVSGQRVYDVPGALSPQTVAALEKEISAIEARSGAQIVIYLQVDPDATDDSNLQAARKLIDQWGIGRSGFDDGLVVLLGLQPDLRHGKVSIATGSGFDGAYLNAGQLKTIIDDDFTPSAREGDLATALRNTLAAVDQGVVPSGSERLQRSRQLNAVLGLVLAPVALFGSVALAYLSWRRRGRDPYFSDSPSVLMAGPPADLTPPLATVVRDGRSGQRSLTTALMELASRRWIAFRDVDVPVVDGEGGPSIEMLPAQPRPGRPMGGPEEYLLNALRGMAGSLGTLDREALGRLHESIGDFNQLLEADAVRLGWFHEQPRRSVARWLAVASVEILASGLGVAAGLFMPSGGALLLGVAFGLGGLVTLAFAFAMPQRTPNGAMVDGMLKAYRRTLKLTLEQSRSMEQVVGDPTVRIFAGTPDDAVVWGIALGLHKEVADLLERSLQDRLAGGTQAASAWYPLWLGTSTGYASVGADGTVAQASGGLFSGSPIPDVGGMFNALGTIGSPPPSSGGDGGGGGGSFGGGSSSGGGGASGSF